jgi:hypothetical protein
MIISENSLSKFLSVCPYDTYIATSIHKSTLETVEDEKSEKISMTTRRTPVALKTLSDFNRTMQRIRRIYLLGERNSGTNYIERILLNAFPENRRPFVPRDNKKFPFASHIPVFKFKHMMNRLYLLNATELEEIAQTVMNSLWLLIVRSPCDWVDAMYRTPWHLCPPNDPLRCPGKYIGVNREAVENLTRAEFFRIRWQDYSDDFGFENIFALRTFKLKIYAQLMSVIPQDRIKVTKMNDVEVSPERFVKDMVKQFDLNLRYGYQRQIPSHKQHSTLCLTEEEQELAWSSIDWDLEALFGFTRLDCHTCAQRDSGS